MKTEKLSLKSIKNVLSRAEMKKIMAGSGPCSHPGQQCGGFTGYVCCSQYICYGGGGQTPGTCGF